MELSKYLTSEQLEYIIRLNDGNVYNIIQGLCNKLNNNSDCFHDIDHLYKDDAPRTEEINEERLLTPESFCGSGIYDLSNKGPYYRPPVEISEEDNTVLDFYCDGKFDYTKNWKDNREQIQELLEKNTGTPFVIKCGDLVIGRVNDPSPPYSSGLYDIFKRFAEYPTEVTFTVEIPPLSCIEDMIRELNLEEYNKACEKWTGKEPPQFPHYCSD